MIKFKKNKKKTENEKKYIWKKKATCLYEEVSLHPNSL
jgi:hypothetical protein